MNLSEPSFNINADVRNPGAFFACCGLLELAHCLWPDAEGWFSAEDTLFSIRASTDEPASLRYVIETVAGVGIEGDLSAHERAELHRLESRNRTLHNEGRKLPKEEDERRLSLGKRRREGALRVREPFNLRVAWWQEDSDDIPKTFAGQQEVLRMALAMLSELPGSLQTDRPLEYRCLLQAVNQESPEASDVRGNRKQKENAKVEPFYFDAHRFAHRLDVGFSLDVQEQTMHQ